MIARDVWVCFNLETGAPDAMFRNERDATWYYMAFSQSVSIPTPYQITYTIDAILKPKEEGETHETT
jgi:hypothetical protein